MGHPPLHLTRRQQQQLHHTTVTLFKYQSNKHNHKTRFKALPFFHSKNTKRHEMLPGDMLSGISVSTALLVFGVGVGVSVSSCLYVYNKRFTIIGSRSHGVEYCVVCMSEVSKGEKLRWLKCRHGFHDICIDAWLKVGTTCPICRVDVSPNQSFLVSSMVGLGKRVVKWIENPLSSELTLAFCESLGYV